MQTLLEDLIYLREHISEDIFLSVIGRKWVYRCDETACPDDGKPSFRFDGNHLKIA